MTVETPAQEGGRSMTPWLGGKSVLIVEDEFLIGLMLIKEITRVGGTPLGPVTSVADALKEIECQPVDAVILDAKLVDGSAADLAACLDARGIPYVVVSGYDKENLPNGLRRAPFVAKPILVPVLIEAIEGLAAARTLPSLSLP
jgi:DNA-binding NtrC family response regulator